MEAPFLALLAREPELTNPGPTLRYSPTAERLEPVELGGNWLPTIVGTHSEFTKADQDPTSDESTDR